ncbi:hypothetical protein BJY01DRAFT_29248 [Aspergillus pseudoustus]|uniref:Uncharacterized protein n=1 Tax=Aspergillus pseudoustus TaxID=1810923 RepID=A0ABR4JGK8_9EURO
MDGAAWMWEPVSECQNSKGDYVCHQPSTSLDKRLLTRLNHSRLAFQPTLSSKSSIQSTPRNFHPGTGSTIHRTSWWRFNGRSPISYWIRRFYPDLIFEVQDLVNEGRRVDWMVLCLELEALFINQHWYCNSGLRRRKEIIDLARGVKPVTDRLIKEKKERMHAMKVNGC